MFRTVLPVLVISAAFILSACGDAEEDDNGVPVDTSGQSDSDGTDGTDSDTGVVAASPYDGIDCVGLGGNPAKCEYETCQNLEFYTGVAERCEGSQTPRCVAEIDCYYHFTDCMSTACPPGTDVPADKSEAGIYVCKNDLDECLSLLPAQ